MLQKEICSFTQKPFPMRMILKVVGYSSSTWYEKPLQRTGKRGRKPNIPDDEALELIKMEIKQSKFKGEGYIKIKSRLQRKKHIIGKERVNIIMRENKLLSPHRTMKVKKKKEHTGTIITKTPDVMWATDGKKFFIDGIGWHWFFGVIEHFNDEILSWHIAKKGNRFAAMEPVRAAVKKQFGNIDKDVCKGLELQLRSDHGSQYDSADFMREMSYLGLNMSKAFVRSPQCNGCIERFHRTLEEELFSVETFSSFNDAYEKIDKFINDYNNDWIIHRLKCLSPIEYRAEHAESQRKLKDLLWISDRNRLVLNKI